MDNGFTIVVKAFVTMFGVITFVCLVFICVSAYINGGNIREDRLDRIEQKLDTLLEKHLTTN